MGHFSSKIQQSTVFLLQNVASSKEKRPRLKNKKNKMQPTNPNAHTYVDGTDVKKHGYAVTQNTFLKQFI